VATDFEGLIPSGIASQLIAAAELESVCLSLGSVQPMPNGAESIPIVSVEPDAEWVDPRYGGRKKATTIEWTASRLEAEELACVLAIPQAWVDDTGFDVWTAVRSRLASAFAKRIDETLLFAVAPVPSSFPVGGVVAAAGAALTGTDALEAIDKGLAAVEAEGLVPNGIASGPSIGTALRQELRTIGSLPSASPASQVYGVDVAVTPIWDASVGDALIGDWSKLVVGVRQDIRFETSSDAIIQDGSGAIIANAFQDDLVAMRCFMRLGAAIGRPVGPDGTPVSPFSLVDWTSGTTVARAAKK
jgi:hypothetical protein